MPSAMPSQSPRKACKPRRKLTTLSFEQLDRARTTIFTENISSSSRVKKPSYVLRQGDVVGANMPDTIQLSKHRSKIYVGLSDTSSMPSGRRESKGMCRADVTSSAATTIGKASIIDWTDACSDVSGNVPLAGELSFLLPPVQGLPNVTSHHHTTPPGLDTTDIFNYRAVHHKRKGGVDKSPRNHLPSRGGGSRFIAGLRPPQNTPFTALGRSDDFVGSLRKKITPRATLERCNVVVCGGGIAPVPGISRESRLKTLYSRESNNNALLHDHTKRRNRSRDPNTSNNNNNNAAGIGVASFDLPVIDLKCVESPIADLGDLEEKGIRLVKLKNVKKKRRQSMSSDSDRNGSLNGDVVIAEEIKSAVDERLESAGHEINTARKETELEPSFVRLALNGGDGGESSHREVYTDRKKKKSITSSSTTRSDASRRNMLEEIGTNREPYATPLLPNLDTNRSGQNSLSYRSPHDTGAKDTTRLRVDVTAAGTVHPEQEISNTTNHHPGINVVVENLDPTPVNPLLESGTTTPNTNLSPRSPREEGGWSGGDSDGQQVSVRRPRNRTSSLLSVPASIISECRPPSPPGRDCDNQQQQQQQLPNDAVFEGGEEDGSSGGDVVIIVGDGGGGDGVVGVGGSNGVVGNVGGGGGVVAGGGIGRTPYPKSGDCEVLVDIVMDGSKTISTQTPLDV